MKPGPQSDEQVTDFFMNDQNEWVEVTCKPGRSAVERPRSSWKSVTGDRPPRRGLAEDAIDTAGRHGRPSPIPLGATRIGGRAFVFPGGAG